MGAVEHYRHREEAMENNQKLSHAAGALPDEQPATQKPVAYDTEGRPLYAAPTNQIPPAQEQQTQIVHMTRSVEPVEIEISPELKERHEASKKAFPWLNLSEHEYIVRAVRRHSIGMWGPLGATALSVSLVFIFMINYPFIADILGLSMGMYGLVLLIGILFVIMFVIGGYLAIWVYTNNHFFLTNESVIQEIQSSIFSKKEQTVSLMNIEDASFSQKGPLQTMLNYGSIRLSTEGDETTYRFDYVANPKEHIAILNNAVESFKNGRPVDLPVDTGKALANDD